jgi:hypothetical protein
MVWSVAFTNCGSSQLPDTVLGQLEFPIMRTSLMFLPIGLLVAAGAALAQMPQLPKVPSAAGGLPGLTGAALPNVASVGAGNAAGVLGYCLKNKLLSGNGATGVLGQLTGRSVITSSPGFADGQNGQLQTSGNTYSLSSLTSSVKSRVCNMVLSRARSFL